MIKNNDVCIILKPFMDNKKWTGDVSVSLVSSNGMTLDKEDQVDLLKLARRICALVPMMSEDSKLEQAAEMIAREHMPIDVLLTDDIKTDDNVISIDFSKK